MKKTLIRAALSTIIAATMTSCGGGSAQKAIIYGEIPGIFAEYNSECDAIEEKAKGIDNAEEFAKLVTKADKLKDELKENLQKAGESYSGSTIDAEGVDGLCIEQPLTLIYDGFFSSTSVRFKVEGKVVATKDIEIETSESEIRYYTKYPERLIARNAQLEFYDAEGNELMSCTIGSFKTELSNGSVIIPSGSVMELNQSLTISEKGADDVLKTTSLKVSPF